MEIIIDLTISQIKSHSGVGQYSKNIAREMMKHEDHAFVLILFEGENPIEDDLRGRENVFIYEIKRPPRVFENLLPFSSILAPHLKNIKEEYPTAVFFSPYVLNGFPTQNFKTVVTIHDFAMPAFKNYSDRGPLINWYRRMQYWYYMNRTPKADHIITISKSTRRDYKKYYPSCDDDMISITPLGVELEEKETEISNYLPEDYKKRGYFIYLGGGIQKNKNTAGVIRAYHNFLQRLNEGETKPYLVIAGKIFDNYDFPEMIRLRSLMRELDVEDDIHLTGFFTDISKYSLLKNSLGFIHLSLYEGFGIAVAEAMRTAVPVIVHNGTSYPEVVGNTGYLVDGRDPSDCGKALYSVYSNREEALERAEQGRERSLAFDWRKTATETLRIIEENLS